MKGEGGQENPALAGDIVENEMVGIINGIRSLIGEKNRLQGKDADDYSLCQNRCTSFHDYGKYGKGEYPHLFRGKLSGFDKALFYSRCGEYWL